MKLVKEEDLEKTKKIYKRLNIVIFHPILLMNFQDYEQHIN